MTKYDKRHGGPFDRGMADFWYHRPPQPHYYVGGTYTSDKVTQSDMTEAEIEAYHAGYAEAEACGGQKDYG
jgi:hypothetical protein